MKRIINKSISGILVLCITFTLLFTLGAYKVEAQTINKAIYTDAGDGLYGIILEDNSLWMMGFNDDGQVGDGTTDYAYTPVKVMDNVSKVSCGGHCAAAIKTDGSLWMWGSNYLGKLGDGTTTSSKVPVKIMDGVSQVSCGGSHTAAIKTDGSLWMWGNNEVSEEIVGVIGEDYPAVQNTPVKVMDNVSKVCCGIQTTLVLKKDNSLWQWGFYYDETQHFRSKPTKIMENVSSIDCETAFVAIKTDGSLWSWKYFGSSTPSKVLDSATEVSTCSYNNNAAITSDGKLWVWGDNTDGKLGAGSITTITSPKNILNDVSHVSICYYGGIVIKKDGTVWKLGWNVVDGMVTHPTTPTQIPFNVSDEAQKYTISYDANGGTNAPAAQVKTAGVDLKLSSSAPTRTNYSFKGWSLDKNSTSAQYQPGDIFKLDGNYTLFAVWEKVSTKYTISFDANGGTNAPAAQEKTAGVDLKLSSSAPTRTNYSFKGWSLDKNSTSAQYQPGGLFTLEGNRTLYAVWENASAAWTRDNEFSWSNSKANFNTGKYTMLDSDYKKLCNYLDKMGYSSYKNKIEKEKDSTWGGSCFGMAAASLLDYTNQIGFNENFDSGKNTIHGVSSPNKNRKVMSAINYYFMAQFIPPTRYINHMYEQGSSTWSSGLKQLVTKAKSGEKLLFCYFFKSSGHAIVIKGYNGTDSNGNHQLIAYDNRYPDRDIIVKVSSSYYTCVVNGSENAYAIEYASDLSAYDKIDIDGPNNDMVLTSAINSDDPHNSKTDIYIPASGEITVENTAGDYIVVSDGSITESTMSVQDEHLVVYSTTEGEDKIGEIVITVEDSDSFSFSSNNNTIKASVVADNYFGDVEAENATSVTMSEQDGTYIFGDGVEYTLYQSVDEDSFDMFSCSGKTSGDANISYSNDKISITGHGGGDITVGRYADGDSEEVSFNSQKKNVSITMVEPESACVKNGHTFGDWVITKEATEIAAGVETRTCSVCGETQTQEIEQLEPTLTSVKISKLAAGKKSVTVKWKKLSKKKLKKISKIQIQYSTSKDFSENVKTKYASAKKTSYKIKSLKKGKRYYIRIRAYKKTNGVVHVSKWSSVKNKKAK